jgi:hypothetical protein
MTTEFAIRRTGDELHFRVVTKFSIVLRWFLPLFLAAILALLFARPFSPGIALIVIFAGIFIGAFVLRNRFSDLQVNNFEFVARVPFVDRYRATKVIPRADIVGFKCKKNDFTAPIGRPRGLYATRRLSTTCILAYLDEKQCNEAVEAIYERFPEMRESAPFERR